MEINGLEIAFSSVVGLQVIYWLVWLVGVLRIKKLIPVKDGHGVSVVIAARNELSNLKVTLPAILDQDYSTYEVIVVNDRSTDGTYEYLQEEEKSVQQLKVLNVHELPDHVNAKKYAITLGIKSAQYDQILLTDADCKPDSKNWIASFAQQWEEKTSFVLGFSHYEKKPGLLNYFIRFETILTGIQYIAAAALGKPNMGVGRNLSYSKTLFLSKKGFIGYQNLVGGDDDLFVNKHASGGNTRITIGSESTTTSFPKNTWSQYLAQKLRHLSIGKHYSVKSKIILSGFTLTWIMSWALLISLLVSNQFILPLGLFLVRILLITMTFSLFSKKTGSKINLLGLFLLDFMFVLYYFVTGTRALLVKQIKWS